MSISRRDFLKIGSVALTVPIIGLPKLARAKDKPTFKKEYPDFDPKLRYASGINLTDKITEKRLPKILDVLKHNVAMSIPPEYRKFVRYTARTREGFQAKIQGPASMSWLYHKDVKHSLLPLVVFE